MRHDLSSEAIRLARLFLELLPDPETVEEQPFARCGAEPGRSECHAWQPEGRAPVRWKAFWELDNDPVAHSAKEELCRRAGQMDAAKTSFEKALAFTSQEQQRRFLERRLAEIK